MHEAVVAVDRWVTRFQPIKNRSVSRERTNKRQLRIQLATKKKNTHQFDYMVQSLDTDIKQFMIVKVLRVEIQQQW